MAAARQTLHVISPLSWIADAFEKPFIDESAHRANILAETDIPGWRIVRHCALEPVEDIAGEDAVWIAPEILASLNAWRQQQSLVPLLLRAPSARWPERLSGKSAGRSMLIATAGLIRAWHAFPHSLGMQPWTQLGNGRADGFNAARRDLAALQLALSGAPANSRIVLSEHVPGIREEWNILVHRGTAAAASPYCLHAPPDSHTVVTVFDLSQDVLFTASPAHFHHRYRTIASRIAEQAAAETGTHDASMIIAFRNDEDAPIVLEIDPVWCATPYPYDATGMLAFMQAIADGRAGSSAHCSDSCGGSDPLFEPDPWMAAQYAKRYLHFRPASHRVT
jgi:hypothetical protein